METIRSTTSETDGRFTGRKSKGLFLIKNFFSSILIYQSFRIFLGAIFLWSGISKLTSPENFAVIIESYGLITGPLALRTALVLSTIEVLAGMGLLADIRGSLAVITGLLGLFIVVLSYGIWLEFDVDCGCFGPEDPESEAFHGLRSALFRDIMMLFGIFYIYFWRHRQGITTKSLTNLVRSFKKKEA